MRGFPVWEERYEAAYLKETFTGTPLRDRGQRPPSRMSVGAFSFSTAPVKTGWKKYEKGMVWRLSVKSKADKCLVQTQQGLQESTKEDAMGNCVCTCVCVFVCVCVWGSESVCPCRQCQHSSSHSVLTLPGPDIPQRNLKYICSCWNQSSVVAMSSF